MSRYTQRSQYDRQQNAPITSTVSAEIQDELWGWFTAVDTDHSGSITVRELQRALVNGNWTNFDLDTCQMLMNIFDTDRSGTIGFHEFSGLWKYIGDWQGVFGHFDQDNSGSIDRQELANALRSFGYNLPPPIISLIQQKYGSLPNAEIPQLQGCFTASTGITFDRFVRGCVAVKTLTESFQREDSDRDGWVQMNYETFMRVSILICSILCSTIYISVDRSQRPITYSYTSP
ncbi:EF-hand [Ramaria rubella]|nr:EF-hand [Ramaria rubella]